MGAEAVKVVTMGLSEKRRQFNSKAFKAMLKEYKPLRVCCNCGAEHGLVWHHVVPLAQGGENVLSNIVVVCSRCHRAIHGEREARAYKAGLSSGRKPKRPDGWQEIVRRYIYCEIGKAECERLLGVARLNDCGAVKEYMERHGIVEYRNNIDLLNAQSNKGVRGGVRVGYVSYVDGKTVPLIYSENACFPKS